MERKRTHYKLYKAKKQWITACSILVVGTGFAMVNSTVAHADTVPGSNNSEGTQITETMQETAAASKQVMLSSAVDGENALTDETKTSETALAAQADATDNVAAASETTDAQEEAVDSSATADETLQNAEAHAGQVINDQSNNYSNYVQGQSQTITMPGGVTATLDSNVINDKHASAKLTLSGAAEAGETYTILIPAIYADDRRSIPSVPPAYAETNILLDEDADNHEYWEVTYKFTKRANFKQEITLIRNTSVNLTDLFADSGTDGFYRPYDLIAGQIKVIHDTNVTNLGINYQLPMLFKGDEDSLSLENASGGFAANGADVTLSIPLKLGFANQGRDLFGTSSIAVSDFSFNLTGPAGQNIADWIKLGSNTGKIITENGDQGIFHVNLMPQGNNIIRVNVTGMSPLTFTRWNIDRDWTATIPFHLQLPANAFANAGAEIQFQFSAVDLPMQIGNAPFTSSDSGITFKVLQPTDDHNAQIQYEKNKTYQIIDAGRYITNNGGEKVDSQPSYGQDIAGQYYESGYKVAGISNVGSNDLRNVHYVLDIPDGIAIYSITYSSNKLKNVPDKLELTLANGEKVELTKEQLQGKSSISLWHNPSRDGYYIDSRESIRRVEAFYSTVLGKSDFGITASKDNNGYRIETNYASGQPVKNGDKLYFNAQIDSADPANKFTRVNLPLCEVYIKGFVQGVRKRVIEHQLSGKAGDVKAGSMAYQIADSPTLAYHPDLEHPVAYIKVPNSAFISDLSKITVKAGADNYAFGHALTPKSVSVIGIGDATFIKVDLSNYDRLQLGFTITVPYGNALDAQPGSELSPFLVVADNLSDEVKEVDHFSSDPDAKMNTVMQQLIAQEGINTERTSYVGTGSVGSGKWVISQGVGMTSYTMVSDNQSVGGKFSGEQSINKPNAETFNLYGSISNATSQKIHGAVEIVNVPEMTDGHSEFTPVMAGPAKLSSISGNNATVAPSEQERDIADSAELLYRLSPMALGSAQSAFDPDDGTWLTADQITDWSLVKAVAVSLIGQEIPPYTTLRLVIPVKDQQIYHHVGKTIYVSSAIFSVGDVGNSGLPTLTIDPASKNSARLKVIGEFDEQTLDVTFIDDTIGQTLKTVTKKGQSNTDSGYNTADDIKGYTAKHYKVVSDSTNGSNLVFDHDDQNNQHYEVHLVHITETKNGSVKKNLIVHYVYADGQAKTGQAADDVQKAITFTRTGTRDLVTDTVEWNAWDQASQTFPVIASPIISGYTADKTAVSNVSVTADSPEETAMMVKYRANEQRLTVDFIDDTTGKTLKTVTKTGLSDADAGYSTANDIGQYENLRYALVSDDTHGGNLVFDHDDSADQYYEVHLKHGTSADSRQDTVNETINYVFENGTAAAESYYAEPITFTQTGVKDLVTGETTWNDVASQTFARHESPVIAGYTADIPVVDAQAVHFGDDDIVKTVTYKAVAQTINVAFIDDTTEKILETVTKTGPSDAKADYNTANDIAKYKDAHYELVSDGTDGLNLTFDHDSDVDQYYEVHFKHGTSHVSQQSTVKETINYVFANGGVAAETYHADPIVFTQTGTRDNVTGKTVWNPVASQEFASHESPVITGYTADTPVVGVQVVNFGDEDIVKTVTYYKNSEQKLEVVFIDDTIGKILKMVAKTGPNDADSGYSTADDIKGYEDAHYELVSDSTNGSNLVFDHDDNVDQHYAVHLKHGTSETSRQDTVNETINYVFDNGETAAESYQAEPIVFTQTGTKDDVTGDITWDPVASQEFARHESPVIAGYTADTPVVDAQEVHFGDNDIVKTVTYKANEQKLDVAFIDDTTGETLKTVTKTGPSDTAVGYNTATDIKTFIDAHYELVSDSTNGNSLVFDHDDNADQHYAVHLKHQIDNLTDTKNVHRTIHYTYADGTPASADVAQTATFMRTGQDDLVTQKTTWGNWTEDQTFDPVASPKIAGYTASQDMVAGMAVTPESEDSEVTVVYSQNPEEHSETDQPDQPGQTDHPDQLGQPDNPEKSEQPSQSDQIGQPTQPEQAAQLDQPGQPQATPAASTEAENKLPQTGNDDHHTALAAGFIGLASLLTMLGFGKKRKQD